MLKPKLHHGFTLIELMVVVTIIGIFMLFGMPEMITYMNSSKVRNTAQTFQAGLMKARAEAIRTNSNVEFVTTSATASTISSTPDVNGNNWSIRSVATVAAPAAVIDSRDASEGSATKVTQATTGLGAGGAPPTLQFNALGGTNQTGNVLFSLGHASNPSCVAASAVRCMGVLVSPSGRIHLCVNDPSIPATDPRRCS